MQQKKGINGTWGDVGSAVQRSMSTEDDAGLVTLYYFIEDQPRDHYYYRVAQKVSVGSGAIIQTLAGSTIAAIALSYVESNIGYRFKIESSETPSIIAESTGSSALLLSQFAIAGTDVSIASYNLGVSGGTINGITERRTISSNTDKGAGGIVGLANDLSALIATNFSLEQSITAGILTTTNIQLGVLNLTSSSSPGSWIGGTSGNPNQWDNALNWADGIVPTSTTNVTIFDKTYNPVIGVAANCKSLDIVTGSVTISPDYSLTVADEIINDAGTGGLVIQSTIDGDGSLIFGSGIPNATVERYITDDEWHLVTPVTIPTTADDFYLGEADRSWLAELNESANEYEYITELTTSLVRGKGYSYWIDDAQGAQTIEFTGTLIGENVVAPLTYSGTGKGWNLIGNPFPSALNVVPAGTNTTGISYVWDNSLSGYLYSSGGSTTGIFVGTLPDDIIPLGQGFIVEATSTGDFTIPKSSRVHNTASFVKSTNNENSEASQFVRIDLDGGHYGNTVFVGFPENGTENFDISNDATKLYSSSENVQFFALENDAELCINANTPLTEGESKTVPLNLAQVTDGTYTMAFSDIDQLENADITLEDLKTGNSQDIRENPVYTFNGSIGDNAARFLLHFTWSPNDINEDIEDASSNMQIYSYENEVYIRSKDEAINQGGEVFVYDLMGHKLSQHRITGSELIKFHVNISSSYVVIKVVKESLIKTQRIFIK